MSETPRHPLSLKSVSYTLSGIDAVTVRADLHAPSADGTPLSIDLYLPPGADGSSLPVVVIVPGYVDQGMLRVLGCRHKEMAATVSWAKLIAASGAAAVAYANRSPAADLGALLSHLSSSASPLGPGPARIGLLASSGNAPVALSALMADAPVRPSCAALICGYTMDLDGASEVAEAAKMFRFENACAGRRIDDLATGVPLFIARAGGDEMPGLNAALDRFAAAALKRNLPMTLVNHPEGPHAFDVMEDSAMSQEVVRRVLQFLGFHLQPAAPGRA